MCDGQACTDVKCFTAFFGVLWLFSIVYIITKKTIAIKMSRQFFLKFFGYCIMNCVDKVVD